MVELVKMQNHLHAYEIKKESIFIMKMKHIPSSQRHKNKHLKFSIKLYCVNTQYESVVRAAASMYSNVQNEKLMGYWAGQTAPSSLPTSASGAEDHRHRKAGSLASPHPRPVTLLCCYLALPVADFCLNSSERNIQSYRN